MTDWYTPHIIAERAHTRSGWTAVEGAAMTLDQAKAGLEAGTVIMCQKREVERTLLLAIVRRERAKVEPVGKLRAGNVR